MRSFKNVGALLNVELDFLLSLKDESFGDSFGSNFSTYFPLTFLFPMKVDYLTSNLLRNIPCKMNNLYSTAISTRNEINEGRSIEIDPF